MTKKILNENEIVDYLENHGWNKTKPGLSRTIELLDKVGRPQDKLKFIHVAGTNGKGSTCAMLSSILMSAGYIVGFYPSPYLVDFKERIQVNRENITSDALVRIANYVIDVADTMCDHPSYFEMVTVIGMLYFLEKKCDIVLLETGMGGRLDSTNVIEKPEVSVITNIGLDHTEFLGDTIEKIAVEKAGIIKTGCPVVSYNNNSNVKLILEAIASDLKSEIYFAQDENIISLGYSIHIKMQTFAYQKEFYNLSLLGTNQLKNAAVVLKVVEVLNKRGWNVELSSILKGLMEVKWPARFEILSTSPTFVLDGGHNPQCAQALKENIEMYFEGKKVTFILGILKDKDYKEVLDIILPLANKVICVTPSNPRAFDASDLKDVIINKLKESNMPNVEVVSKENVLDAINESKQSNVTVCFGSLYLAGEIIKEFTNE